ncbi:MAG TPA: ADP-ribosylglycohydrolase family protein [Desulfobacterales bacterium]
MSKNAEAVVLASFVADSLALGAHWIYDTKKIDNEFGRVDRMSAPLPNSFHAGKAKGEHTHYGDQGLALLQSVANSKGFDLMHFSRKWREMFDDYDGYFDKATKETLRRFADGKPPAQAGSGSSDLAGAARIAPLVYRYRNDESGLIEAARAQTAMTHNHPEVIAAAGFLARATLAVLGGKPPVAAIREQAESQEALAGYIQKGLERAATDTREAIGEFGQMCETPAALPAVVHLIARYENDLEPALIENVMAGGDSAARGMAVGMVLGAHLGRDAIPKRWLSEMKTTGRIEALLQEIDSHRS